MKHIALFFTLLPLVAATQSSEKTFTLDGQIRNFPDSVKVEWVLINYANNGEMHSDSVKPKNGRYHFNGKIAEPVLADLRLLFPGQTSTNPYYWQMKDAATIFLEPGKQEAISSGSFANITVAESQAHDEYAKLTKAVKEYRQQLKPLYDQRDRYFQLKDKEGQQKAALEIRAANVEMTEKIFGEYVRQNPGSPIAMYALLVYAGGNIDADKAEPLYNSLSAAVKQYPSAIIFKEELRIAKNTGIGRIAPDFVRDDTLGQPVSLSSFRGKYVLIDFWASWCGPCRAENPNVIKVFTKYKDKNFDIIAITLDQPKEKEKWLKAIKEDRLPWTQLSDWDKTVINQYGIHSIPQNLLIDPQGKIIAKNIRGDDLEVKVSEAIEGTKTF